MAKKIKIKAAAVVTENNTPLSVLNTVVSSAEGFIDHDTTYTARSPISISSSNEISIDESKLSGGGEIVSYTAGTGINIQNDIISLSDTVLSAETTVGPTGDQETSANGSINVTVPQITVDKTGRVTSLTSRNIKITDTNTVTDPGNPSVYTADTPIQISADNKISLTTIPESLGGTGETSLSGVTVGGANNAASVGGHTVGINVPANAVFTDSHYTALPSSEALSTNNVGIRITENNQVSGTVTLTGGGGTTVSRDSSGKILITSTATETGTDNDTHYQAIPTIISGTTNQTAAIGIKENNTMSGSVTLKAGANVSINGSGTQITISAADAPVTTPVSLSSSGAAISLSGGGSGYVTLIAGDSNTSVSAGSANQIKITNTAPHKQTNLSLSGGNTLSLSGGGAGTVTFVSNDANLSIGGGSTNQVKITNKAPHVESKLSLGGSATTPVLTLSGGGSGSVTLKAGDNVKLTGESNAVTISAESGESWPLAVHGTSVDLNTYTTPGKYWIQDSSTNKMTNGPGTPFTTYGFYAYLTVEPENGNATIVRQTFSYRNSSDTNTVSWTNQARTFTRVLRLAEAGGAVSNAGDWITAASDIYFNSSAPANMKIPGRLWFDTSNNVLSVYDGTTWRNVSNP